MNGLRSCLHNEDLACSNFTAVPVLGPFDIHRPELPRHLRVMILYNTGPSCKEKELIIFEDEAVAFLRSGVDILNRFVRIIRIDHLDVLAPLPFLNNGTFALLQCRFKDIVFIGIYSALYHVFSKTIGPGNKDSILKAALSINREYNACAGRIAPDHFLNCYRKIDIKLAKPLVLTIRDGSVCKKAGKTALAGSNDGLFASDIEVGFLLPGK